MIFFFERAGRFTRCEVHPRANGSAELVITQPDGTSTVEILGNSDVTPRMNELRSSLLRTGWWGPLGREF